MSTKSAAAAVRKTAGKAARRESPPAERFKVVRKSPLLLEAYGSGQKLAEDDSDFEISRGLRRMLSKGDDVMVITDREGDRMAVAIGGASADKEPTKGLTPPNETALTLGTALAVLGNVRTRLNELEARMKELGLLE